MDHTIPYLLATSMVWVWLRGDDEENGKKFHFSRNSRNLLDSGRPGSFYREIYWGDLDLSILMVQRSYTLGAPTAAQTKVVSVPSQKKDVRLTVFAGGGAGTVSTLIMYPLEFLRTRLQQLPNATGPIHVVRTVLAQGGGLRSFYRGLPLPLTAQIIYKANVFTITGATQNIILDRRQDPSSIAPPRLTLTDVFYSGVAAGSINALLVVTPVEFVRNQLIQQPHKTMGSILRQALELRHPFPGYIMWRGVGLAVIRDGLGCGSFFLAHSAVLEASPNKSLMSNVTAGAVAGMSFWLVALPFDTMKTWVQSGDMLQSPPSVASRLSDTYRQGGIQNVVRNLLRGWQMAYGRSAPSAAITMTTYSFFYQQLGKMVNS